VKKTNHAEVKLISSDGFLLEINARQYFAAFHDFPFLYDLPVSEAYKVCYLGDGDIRWENADIDLNVAILKNPDAYPIVMHALSDAAAAQMGRKGGTARSTKKAAASRANGHKGGRPPKPAPAAAQSI